jgi:hypothetical protein
MTGFNLEELAGLEPIEVARVLKRTPAGTLGSLMRGEHRREILDLIFTAMPRLFRPEKAGSTSAVIHWYLTGRPDGGVDTYQLAIADRTCTTAPLTGADDPTAAEPRLTITMGAVEFLQLISGASNPTMMFMMGKIKAKGDLGLAASFANLFDMPRG